MNIRAYAKINLMLDITGKKDNGYHTLFMLMQSVDLFDEIEVNITDGSGIFLSCDENGVPCDETNTAYKAAAAFCKKTGIQKKIEIGIKKKIPHQAGLAGGSADAAGVIVALDRLCETSLSVRELTEVGLSVGSDVPFCIFGGTAVVQHTGDVIAPVKNLSEYGIHFVLCKPDAGVSTVAAYGQYDDAQHIRHLDCESMLAAAADGDLKRVCMLCDNVFEQVIDVPQRAQIKVIMRKNGCLCCCMSGSGPTVYGVFDSREKAEKCAADLDEKYGKVFVCRGTERGVN